MSAKEPDVSQAYALETPEDAKRLYRSWARTYDSSFAAEKGFAMPSHVAELFSTHNGRGPVLDAGAGTGLVAEAILARGPCEIDAFDLSRDMLEQARAKNVYRNLFEGDLTAPLPFADQSFQAIVSSGTFTHGHVGPEALDELIRVAAPEALFVLTIKKDHFQKKGFDRKFQSLSGHIRDFTTEIRPIYTRAKPGDASDDQGLLAVFRKA